MLVWVAIGVALIDWSAVYTQRARVESFAKSFVLILLIAAVVQQDPTTTGWVIAAGLTMSLIGDVLLLPSVDWFLGGLVAFLMAHLIYIAAFVGAWNLSDAQARWQLLVGFGLALAMWLLFGRPISSASKAGGGGLSAAVTAYVIVLSSMMITGFGVGSVVLALGALLFAASDGVLGWNRFVGDLAYGRVATHVLYHLGQTLFAVWAINLS